MEKAYKLLSIKNGISNREANQLIDRGLVSVNGKKIEVARELVSEGSRFKVLSVEPIGVIYRDENILAIDKPAFINSSDAEKSFKGWVLLHRLDIETSGVMLLVKDSSEFHKKAKEEFKKRAVYKEYLALVSGIVSEEREINAPIITKKDGYAKSKVDSKGLDAYTDITPLQIIGKNTLLKVVIKTGRTHQIRVHLAHIGHPIVGDTLYGGVASKRVMLHAKNIKMFSYDLHSSLPKEFILLNS